MTLDLCGKPQIAIARGAMEKKEIFRFRYRLLSRARIPSVVRWAEERHDMEAFVAETPFRVDLRRRSARFRRARNKSWKSSSSFT